MKTRLTIGLLKAQAGWQMLLEQIGISYEPIKVYDDELVNRYSVIIINDKINSDTAEYLDSYVQNGGGILDLGNYVNHSSRNVGEIRSEYRKYIQPDRFEYLFQSVGLLDIHSKVNISNEATHLEGTIFVEHKDKGRLAFCGLDINALMLDTSSVRKQYYIDNGLMPNETVGRVSKGELRKLVVMLLKWLHITRDLPFVHLWHFPDQLPCLFGFRVDSDFGTQEAVTSLYRVAQRNKISMTWFLHVEAHKDWLGLFKGFENQEMAVHGYRHKTFSSYADNLENITYAKSLLDDAGISYQGFCAPYGIWNTALAEAINDAGLEYSSEFALDYDNLPFFPESGIQGGTVLQIPIHPICIGSFFRAKSSDEVIKSYFERVIRQKKQEFEPVFLYHHPLQNKLDIIDHIFGYANQLGIKNMTMGEYARWWKRRSALYCQCFTENQELMVTTSRTDSSMSLAVHTSMNGFSLFNPDEPISLKKVPEFETVSESHPSHQELKKQRSMNFNMLKSSILDIMGRLGS